MWNKYLKITWQLTKSLLINVVVCGQMQFQAMDDLRKSSQRFTMRFLCTWCRRSAYTSGVNRGFVREIYWKCYIFHTDRLKHPVCVESPSCLIVVFLLTFSFGFLRFDSVLHRQTTGLDFQPCLTKLSFSITNMTSTETQDIYSKPPLSLWIQYAWKNE